MRLPFWDRVSENGKQALAVVAVFQALHFVLAVPYGVYDGWRWSQQMDTQVWQPKVIAVSQGVIATISRNENSPFPRAVGGYREYCHGSLDDYEIFGVTRSGCDGLPSLTSIIKDNIEMFDYPTAELDFLFDELSILYGIPIELISVDALIASES